MSNANVNRLHQRWTRQLLCRNALLPRPSSLKLLSLPVASGSSIFPPHARRCLALGPHPPPTMRSCFIGSGRGGVIATKIVASCVRVPPAFCTEAKVAKGGAYLRDTTVLTNFLVYCEALACVRHSIVWPSNKIRVSDKFIVTIVTNPDNCLWHCSIWYRVVWCEIITRLCIITTGLRPQTEE